MKRVPKVSNVHGEVYFKQKQRLKNAFTRNTFTRRKRSHEGAEDNLVINMQLYQI